MFYINLLTIDQCWYGKFSIVWFPDPWCLFCCESVNFKIMKSCSCCRDDATTFPEDFEPVLAAARFWFEILPVFFPIVCFFSYRLRHLQGACAPRWPQTPRAQRRHVRQARPPWCQPAQVRSQPAVRRWSTSLVMNCPEFSDCGEMCSVFVRNVNYVNRKPWQRSSRVFPLGLV